MNQTQPSSTKNYIHLHLELFVSDLWHRILSPCRGRFARGDFWCDPNCHSCRYSYTCSCLSLLCHISHSHFHGDGRVWGSIAYLNSQLDERTEIQIQKSIWLKHFYSFCGSEKPLDIYVIKWTRPSPSIFAYSKWSKLDGGKAWEGGSVEATHVFFPEDKTRLTYLYNVTSTNK